MTTPSSALSSTSSSRMPSIFKSKSKSPKTRKECIGPIVYVLVPEILSSQLTSRVAGYLPINHQTAFKNVKTRYLNRRFLRFRRVKDRPSSIGTSTTIDTPLRRHMFLRHRLLKDGTAISPSTRKWCWVRKRCRRLSKTFRGSCLNGVCLPFLIVLNVDADDPQVSLHRFYFPRNPSPCPLPRSTTSSTPTPPPSPTHLAPPYIANLYVSPRQMRSLGSSVGRWPASYGSCGRTRLWSRPRGEREGRW